MTLTINTPDDSNRDPSFFQMNQEALSLWTEALRSGEFPQGTGQLAEVRDGKVKYCCLGVLCEVAYRAGKTERRTVRFANIVNYAYGKEHADSTSYLPEDVRDWAGLEDFSPLASNNGWLHLTAVNDQKRGDFNEIADLIVEAFGPDAPPRPQTEDDNAE